jgi:hypothetical protein
MCMESKNVNVDIKRCENGFDITVQEFVPGSQHRQKRYVALDLKGLNEVIAEIYSDFEQPKKGK